MGVKSSIFSGMEHLQRHLSQLGNTLSELKFENLDSFISELSKCLNSSRTLFIAGNGGSCAIAEHAATDLSKGLFESGRKHFRAVSLNSNGALLTATANDKGFLYAIASQLEYFAKPNDLVWLISSSGSSKNMINAAIKAKEISCRVIGMTGFGMNPLTELCDSYLTIESEDYQIIEDIHHSVCHAIFKEFVTSKVN